MKKLKVTDFTEFPGPRFIALGPDSGEEYRDSVLIPAITEYGSDIEIDLDGTMGYGSSFLEEAFGGLIRCGIDPEIVAEISKHLISNEDPSLVVEVQGYIKDQIDSCK